MMGCFTLAISFMRCLAASGPDFSEYMSDIEAARWFLVWTAHAMNNRKQIIVVGITGARGGTGFVRQRLVR